ncbi:MAG: hemerythrin domain-containing protein [Myxococcaceae bacterium]
MKPSEVRSRILQDHERLRLAIAELEALVAAAGEGRPAAGLRERTAALLVLLEAHLALEDRLLFPAIHATDSWGPIRAARLQENHLEQRAELARLTSLTTRVSETQLCEAVRVLSRDLRDDMHREEAELLDPDLLRDDLVTIDGFGG